MNSHIIMTNNAMFLLDLASSSSSNLDCLSQKMTLSSVSELGGMDPNPFPLVPFQCFHKLGVRDSHLRLINDELVLDEVLKSSDITDKASASQQQDEITPPEQFQNSFHNGQQEAAASSASSVGKKPFSRSASVGNQVLLTGAGDPTRRRNCR